jgi:hypothetical protein
MQTEIDILTKRLQRVPWGETGVPEALAGLLQPAVSRRVDGGGGRVAFQLLAGLGISGWSARLDVQTAVNGLRQISQANGTYGRAWHLLQAAGLYETHTASFGLRPFVLARLTPLGRTLLIQVGVEVVTSEWDHIEAQHRRAADGQQMAHTAAIGLFLHHARVRGYATAACPVGEFGKAEPDAAVIPPADDAPIYSEIQGRGGAAWRRARKWANQLPLQGYVAICALTPAWAERLAHEAQLVGAALGLVTDLTTLARQAPAGLWTHCWRSHHSPLQPLVADITPAALLGR